MAGHSINLTLDSDGVHAQFECHEQSDGWCRQVCARGCEEWDEECMREHAREQVPYCNPIEFVDNGCYWYETYGGEERQPCSGSIEFFWDTAGFYSWRYASGA